jgi:hypothetical protein
MLHDHVRVAHIITQAPLIHAFEDYFHQPCGKTTVGNFRVNGESRDFRGIGLFPDVVTPRKASAEFTFQHERERSMCHADQSQQSGFIREHPD